MSFQTMIMSMMLFLLSLSLLMMDYMISINFPLIIISSIDLSVGMILDWMSSLFSASVLMISSMIMMFSNSYIHKKDHNRFSLVLLSFVISMITLVFSNNIFFIILGWDGLGLSSYILVIFYMNSKSKESGTITILSNRIGDILIIFSIGLSFTNGITEIYLSKEFPIIMIILLTIAAFTKSAQFPFSSWLPAAMAAPTPISALVHSSTLVTAGTFLLIRIMNNPHPNSSFIILIISTTTILFSGLSANWEQDFKKIIALSTLSQMAMIMFAISINQPKLAYFHLVTHAFFKSTMFLCAGTLIFHSLYQDMRSQGSPSNWSPSLMLSFNITNMALMGLPFLSGFYSKDAIMESLFINPMSFPILMCAIMSVGLTSSYSLRLMSFSSKLIIKSSPDKLYFNDKFIMVPILILIPMSLILGSTLSWLTLPHQLNSMPLTLKLLIPLFVMFGFFLGLSINYKSKNFINMGEASSSLWYLNFLSSRPTTLTTHMGLSSTLSDKTWMENLSANGSFLIMSFLSKFPDMILMSLLCALMLIMFFPTLIS